MSLPPDVVPPEHFQAVLRQTVQEVDRLPEGQRQRWEQLLWVAHALVYHERQQEEWGPCAEFIRATVRTARRAVVSEMRQTLETIWAETQRETLLWQVRLKFKQVPPAIEAKIAATSDNQQLDAWLDALVLARPLSDIPRRDLPAVGLA
jgi:hypothetical protein